MPKTMIDSEEALAWGMLVKSWATGLDYVTAPPAEQPPITKKIPAGAKWALPPLAPVSFPTTVGGSPAQKTIPGVVYQTKEEFNALLVEAGIKNAVYPPETTEVIIVQGDEKTMVVRLPPTVVLQRSEKDLLSGGVYPTPDFYKALFTPPGSALVHPKAPSGKAAIMTLHANRIGDYTMGLCA